MVLDRKNGKPANENLKVICRLNGIKRSNTMDDLLDDLGWPQ